MFIVCTTKNVHLTYLCVCRYKANRAILREQLNKLGFKQLVPEEHAGYIITSYLCPNHPNFSFKQFYSKLSERGKTSSISPWYKLTIRYNIRN